MKLLDITWLLLYSLAVIALGNTEHLLAKGKCKSHVWRTDKEHSLPGKCIGIT